MRPDWTLVAIGVAFAAGTVVLMLVGVRDALPSCEDISGNIDGAGGTPCGDGFDWDTAAVMGAILAAVFAAVAVIALAFGLRRAR